MTPQARASIVDSLAGSLHAAGLVEPPIVLGIDPGLHGALASIGIGPKPEVLPMPTTKSATGRDVYDPAGIIRAIRALTAPGPIRLRHVVAFVERGQPLPSLPGRGVAGQGGSIANYNRGLSRGLFEGILTALGIEYHLVGPKQWQDEMLPLRGGDTGERSIIAARKLFPGVSLFASVRSRTASDGLSDALLIAEFGRRRLCSHGG